MRKIRVGYRQQPCYAVQDVSLVLGKGERLALLGASGCGKTSLCRAILGMLPPDSERAGELSAGGVTLDLKDRVRGRLPVRIAYIPQETAASMHPQLRVGRVLQEVGKAHEASLPDIREVLAMAGLPDTGVLQAYPHELSGGQRQRLLIAQALLCRPDILIADEPTSALDNVLEAAIYDTILQLVASRGLSLVWVSHNPLLSARMDRVAVMLAGAIIEECTPEGLFRHPQHPYTVKLIESLPPPIGEPPSAASRRGMETV